MNNYKEEEKKYQDLLDNIKDTFGEEQTEPRAAVRHALKQRLTERCNEGFWTSVLQFKIPVYQPALALVVIGFVWFSYKAAPVVQIIEKQQPVYVYKTDTLKVPVTKYVYVNNFRKNKAEKKSSIGIDKEPPMMRNTVIASAPFPDSAIRFAESQTGRSLHDDSTYARLFVSLR